MFRAVSNEALARVVERTRSNLFWRHLGVYSALVDMAVGGALSTLHEAAAGGVGQTTLDLNVSLLAGATAGEIFAEGEILKRGRTIVFGEATITDAAGRLLATGRATYMILAPRA